MRSCSDLESKAPQRSACTISTRCTHVVCYKKAGHKLPAVIPCPYHRICWRAAAVPPLMGATLLISLGYTYSAKRWLGLSW